MTKEEYLNLTPSQSGKYISQASNAEIDELYAQGCLHESIYDMIRDLRGTLPEQKQIQRREESLKLRRHMAYFA